jgi:hypothetical protein
LLVAQAVLPGTLRAQASAPADFAIRFAFGVCTRDVLDTFTGVFVRDMGSGEAAVPVPVTLPSDVLHAIYQAVVETKFFDYPPEFSVRGNSVFAPADHYRLEVRSAGITHTVSWRDGIRPSTPEADRLRDLFTMIRRLVSDRPEVKRLPVARVGCA